MQGAGFDPWSRNQCPTCHRATKPLQHNEDPAKPKEKEKKMRDKQGMMMGKAHHMSCGFGVHWKLGQPQGM